MTSFHSWVHLGRGLKDCSPKQLTSPTSLSRKLEVKLEVLSSMAAEHQWLGGSHGLCLTGSTIQRAAGGQWPLGHQLMESSCSHRELGWARLAPQLRYHGVQLHAAFLPLKSAILCFFFFRTSQMALNCQAIRSKAWKTWKKLINFLNIKIDFYGMYISCLCWRPTNKKNIF